MKKILKIGLSILLLIVVIVTAYIFILIRSSIPDWDGERKIEALHDTVIIKLDKYGVPHVYAKNLDDLAFTTGYIHAKERFFQMDLTRRYSAGKLCELFGRRTLQTDIEQRKYQMTRWAKGYLENLSPEMMNFLQKYCEGVNYYLSNEPLPLEYSLLRVEPEPWEPIDSIHALLSMGWFLSSSGSEYTNTLITEVFGEDWTVFLQNRSLVESETITDISNAAEINNRSSKNSKFSNLNRKDIRFPGFKDKSPDEALASNSWVIDGSLSKTGKPILANDPHLGVQNPTQCYQAHLSAPGFNVAGYMLPGSPAFAFGHNERIAWGITAFIPDVIDYFEILTKKDDPGKYKWGEEWLDFEKVTEKIFIKGEDNPEVLKVRITRFGPIYPLEDDKGVVFDVAFKWTGMYASAAIQGLFDLNRAKNFSEFKDAAARFTLPHCNMTYADVDGNIAYYPSGSIPERDGWDGSRIVKASTPADWKGMLDESKKPFALNPDKHFIATANNEVCKYPYSQFLSTDWIVPFRAMRISNLLRDGEKFGIDDIAKMQSDTFSIEADLLLNALSDVTLENPDANGFFTYLKKWDRRFEGGSAPGLYLAFRNELIDNIIRDDLNAISPDNSDLALARISPVFRMLRILNYRTKSDLISKIDLWDDKSTPELETKEKIIENTILEAVQLLKDNFGDEWKNLKWKEMHQVSFNHPLGAFWPLTSVFNRGPYGLNGTSGVILAASYNYSKPFQCGFMPVMRVVYDLSDWDNTLIIKNFGQSGNPFSDHYCDETEKYIKGEYNKMLFSEKMIDKETISTLILSP
ncbi:MAG: penicillin acylase family protein [Acidobacteria bacterium]|nr:penicillin acylase family protein [Acidobacteriota bacterium]